MKKAVFTLSALAMTISLIAGGIVHNTNQSASFIRIPVRDAAFGIDAAYYNPAGLFRLNDGFHLSLSNQYISQNRNIKSTFPGMNLSEFEGSVTAPVFPTAYAVYKKNRFAFSLGFNPIGGGGSALFEKGLPSFEMQPSMIPASLSAAGIPTSQYSLDTEFEGKSIYYGFQGGVSYKVRDEISFSLGLRYVTMSNSYTGFLKNIMINPNYPVIGYSGSMVPATTFFNDLSTYLIGVSNALNNTGNSLQKIIDNGYGNTPLAKGTILGMSPEQIAALQGGIMQVGGDPTGMTIAQAQQFYYGASAQFDANSKTMANNAIATSDKGVDATQKGSAIIPIIGMNLQFTENFNMSVKYEFKAKVDVENDTKKDDVGMFPDKAKVPSDIPGMISVGLQYAPFERLKLHAGFHQYFDRKVQYGKQINNQYVDNYDVMSDDYKEYGLGLEFAITKKFLVSAGYLKTQTGVKEIYQSDLDHSLSTNSFAGGFRYNFNEKIGVDLGVMNTKYKEDTRDFGLYKETYNRKNFVAALGIDISF